MTELLAFLETHPLTALFVGVPLLVVTGHAGAAVVGAPFQAIARVVLLLHRPGDCPRCNGSGRDRP